jgi:two-component system, sensor histidine kinase and response regulator
MSQGIMSLNRSIALERVGGDEALLQEIAGLFLEDYPNLITQIQQAVGAKDAHSLERAAHSLKGSLSNFGSDAAYQAAFDLEQIGRSKSMERSEAALAHLEEVMNHVRPELESLSAGA